MSTQYLITKAELKLILESTLTEFENNPDYLRAISYGFERFNNILAENETRSTRGGIDELPNRPTKENAPTANADIREIFTNENHFSNEQEIKELWYEPKIPSIKPV